MHEKDWEWLRIAHIHGWGGRSFYADLHYTACMIMYGNAWAALRMTENRSYSWRGKVILGWLTLYGMHDNVWECMRWTETFWECLISMEGGRSFHADLHYTTCMRMNWDCIRLCHNGWTCMWWECMRMTENVWECLIFRGCVGRLRLSRIIRHAW